MKTPSGSRATASRPPLAASAPSPGPRSSSMTSTPTIAGPARKPDLRQPGLARLPPPLVAGPAALGGRLGGPHDVGLLPRQAVVRRRRAGAGRARRAIALYATKSGTPTDFAEYKETQVALITSPIVLGIALTAHPELYHLPTLQHAADVEAEIRQRLAVQILPKTNLIRVSMSSKSPIESAAIVNAVVDAYLKNATTTNFEETDRRIKRLKEDQATRLEDVKRKRAGVAAAERPHRRGRRRAASRTATRSRPTTTASGASSSPTSSSAGSRPKPSSTGSATRRSSAARGPGPGADRRGRPRRLLRPPARRPDPAARSTSAQAKLERVKRPARNRLDPRGCVHQNEDRIKSLMTRQRDAWWVRLRPRLERELRSRPPGTTTTGRLSEAELAARGPAESQEERLRDKLDQMKIKSQDAGGDQLNLEFARDDTTRAADVLHKVEDNLNQLQFEASSPIARIHKEFSAKPSNRPNSNNRLKIMALAPFVVLFAGDGPLRRPGAPRRPGGRSR